MRKFHFHAPMVALLSVLFFCTAANSQSHKLPVASLKPTKAQQQQINRKYGMFIHYGINTFANEEWTDGTIPASVYKPKTINTDQWIKSAKDAGMKYVILTIKHHDGFCLWDSKYTDYDVASSGNRTDVVAKVANSCKKYNIGLGLYYSLWDRHEDKHIKSAPSTQDSVNWDTAYNDFMLKQLKEVLDIAVKYTPVVEFWFDGGWSKSNKRWPIQEIYDIIKTRQPNCQVGINWSIGLPENPDYHPVKPEDQKQGYPIRYFPSDFRLGDPYLPVNPDPKIFSNAGKSYYMPWESTVCLSQKWFYSPQDTVYKTLDELYQLYKRATAQQNILILNSPPTTEGVLRQKDIALLTELKKRIAAGK